MKNPTKQYERAEADIAERVRKLLAEARPGVQQKYQLPDELVDMAIYVALSKSAVEGAKPISDLDNVNAECQKTLADLESRMAVIID